MFGKVSPFHHVDACFPLNDPLPLGNRNCPDEGGFKHQPWSGFEPCDNFMLEALCCTLAKDEAFPSFSFLHWLSRHPVGLGWQVARGVCHPCSDFCDLLKWLFLSGPQGWPFLAWTCQLCVAFCGTLIRHLWAKVVSFFLTLLDFHSDSELRNSFPALFNAEPWGCLTFDDWVKLSNRLDNH